MLQALPQKLLTFQLRNFNTTTLNIKSSPLKNNGWFRRSFPVGVTVQGLKAVKLLVGYTPENERMSPENQWLEDVFPIEIVPFYGTFVGFRGWLIGILMSRFKK